MRLVTGTISHETNVFSTIRTGIDEFKKRLLLRGDEVFDHFRGTKTPVGGFLEGCREHGFELVPTVFASATPSGRITDEAFDSLLGEMLDGIADAGSIDGVVLHPSSSISMAQV